MFGKLGATFRIAHGVLREASKRVTRSAEWPKIRRAYLAAYPSCAACGGTRLVQVHHKAPFHLEPHLELDPENLITLCLSYKLCHVKIGHGDDYKAFNPNVVADATACVKEPAMRPLIEERAKQARLYAEKK